MAAGAVKRAFGRAARTYDGAAVLQREVAARMMARLDVVRIAPRWILDLGCGSGAPIAVALHDDGFLVHGTEASPTLAAAFRTRLPDAPLACEAIEASRFFDRRFAGVM
jgi:2-polyprenyl-3-methyl-5-hydroxy-6-metoxy-1,4-benzoquinol methylase